MIKKIETKESKEKKEKRNMWILSGVLVAILLFSIFGIVFQDIINTGSSSGNQSVTFNGYNFQVSNGYYTLNAGNTTLYFSVNPNQVNALAKNVNLSKTYSYYSNQVVYVSSAYDYNSYNEIYQDLNPFSLRVQGACVEGEKCVDKTLPIKTCADNVIIVKLSNQSRIYTKDNCVYIEGNQTNLLPMTDEFLLKIFGIEK